MNQHADNLALMQMQAVMRKDLNRQLQKALSIEVPVPLYSVIQ